MDFVVRTVELNELQLFNIPKYVEELEMSDVRVKEAGVFKVVLPTGCRSEGTSLHELISLKDCKNRLSAAAEKQVVVAFQHSPNLYGHRSFEADPAGELCSSDEVNAFVNSVTSLKNWTSQETCCTSILTERGPKALADHFFLHVIGTLAESKRLVCTKQTKLSALCSQGKRDAANVTKFMTSLHSRSAKERRDLIRKSLLSDKRSVEEQCGCDGCISSEAQNSQLGVMYGKGVDVLVSDEIRMTESFGLECLASTSLLRLLKHKYPGITNPFLYYGSLHSFFPAHIEDFSLYSWNYLHYGQPKIWIVVPPKFALKLSLSIMNASPNLVHSSCFNLLGHKYFIPTPQWLLEREIPFKVVVQNEGESVIVSPNAVHWGWNTGFNIAEACNFATTSWIPYGIVAPKCSCLGGEVHMDLQRLIAAVRPDLLECYRSKSVPQGEHEMFYQSILRINVSSFNSQPDGHNKEEARIESDDVSDAVSDEDGNIFPEVAKKRTGRKLAICPVMLCQTQYKYGSKLKLLNHINAKHKDPEVFRKAMDDFNLLFPERNKCPKKTCFLCEKLIAGRGAAMKRHQKSGACIHSEK